MGFAYNFVDESNVFSSTRVQTQALLRPGEAALPDPVSRTIEFLDRLGVWYIISRNSPATSCRDAIDRRIRLGSKGIPLCDELKTLACTFEGRDGHPNLVFLHCRAHKQFDLEKAGEQLGSKGSLAKLEDAALAQRFGIGYGTVNPFTQNGEIHQCFDESVLEGSMPPHTMMTNAGESTWAVEFSPRALVHALRQGWPEKIRIGAISVDAETSPNPGKAVFGIVTGNGPDSGMALWRSINREVLQGMGTSFKGDLSYPPVIVRSIPELGLSMELGPREDDVWAYLSKGIEALCQDGVTHIALACHTSQYFGSAIQSLCGPGTTYVSMAQTVIGHLQKQRIRDFTLIGIPYVADLGEWSAYRELAAVHVERLSEKAREPMLELGYLIKKMRSDRDRAKALNKLHHVLRVGVTTESVLIALTEISVLLEHFPKQQEQLGRFKIIDPLAIYGARLAKIHLETLTRNSGEKMAGLAPVQVPE